MKAWIWCLIGLVAGVLIGYYFRLPAENKAQEEPLFYKEYIEANNKALINLERAYVAEIEADSLSREVERIKKNRAAIIKKQKKEYEKINTLSSVNARIKYLDSIWTKHNR